MFTLIVNILQKFNSNSTQNLIFQKISIDDSHISIIFLFNSIRKIFTCKIFYTKSLQIDIFPMD